MRPYCGIKIYRPTLDHVRINLIGGYEMSKKPIATIWQYEIYADGLVYDTKNAQDIPEYIFIIRDTLIHQQEKGAK